AKSPRNHTGSGVVQTFLSKNIRYLYQNEYRFAWTMPEDSMLAPFFVELGPLDDIAEIFELA
ncbi:MAG TPA: hypothetical protein PKE41_00460, partial [Candidatus Macondimonas sp.]|nr:hypothetical protein [Candidatus Macondimonas sp.]